MQSKCSFAVLKTKYMSRNVPWGTYSSQYPENVANFFKIMNQIQTIIKEPDRKG